MDSDGFKRPIGRGRAGRIKTRTDGKEESPTRSPGTIAFPNTSSSPTTPLEALSLKEAEAKPAVQTRPEPEESEPQSHRGARRGARTEERRDDYDYVASRPSDLDTKQGKSGQVVPLLTNYFVLKKPCQWALYQHSVKFNPFQDNTMVKKAMLRQHKDIIGVYIFDGTTIFTPKLIMEDDTINMFSIGKDGVKYGITVTRFGKLAPGHRMYMQFYNLIIRKCLFGMELEEMGRNFFDHKSAIEIPGQNLVLWPGFVTAMRLHEEEVMLCVEVTHKVLRLDSVLNLMRDIRNNCRGGDWKVDVKTELLAGVILTHYNRKTYRVEDILWDQNPLSKFDMKGNQTTYVDYYKAKYQMVIKDMKQPLLVVRPTKRDMHRGESGLCYLVPELCQMTGLTDAMRADFPLMKDLSKHLHMEPANRVNAVNNFMKRLLGVDSLNAELERWNVGFNPDMVKCNGRILPKENIVFSVTSRNPEHEKPNDKADWTMAFRSRQMLKVVPLEYWVVIVPERDASNIDNLVRTMTNVAKPLNFIISRPLEIVKLPDSRPASYMKAIDTTSKKYEMNIQMTFIVLPNNKLELYASVKKRLSVDIGIPSQCFVGKNLTSKGLMSIATKVVIQMNAKLGGQPWSIELPLKNLMMVGFDVHHSAKGSANKNSIGAMVSTTSANYASYYSTVSYHANKEELSTNLVLDMTKCVHAYEKVNGVLPDRIIFFRDGVGDGQLAHVFDSDLEQIKLSLAHLYETSGVPFPKLSYIIVTKKINTRLFDVSRRPDNPPPGTIVDNTITLPERYDFFLVSQAARQGTVSPCNYNVLLDTQGLGADKLQRIAFKMCHMYFNWSGTVAVPAPCQYAHKLAFLTGMALNHQPIGILSNLLHFL